MTKITNVGFDISTTTCSACAYTNDGKVLFASTPMLGATTWRGQPAFDFCLIEMFKTVLSALRKQCNGFATYGTICISCRQHDMVLLNEAGNIIIPALNWQCVVAEEETKMIEALGAEKKVGKIEFTQDLFCQNYFGR